MHIEIVMDIWSVWQMPRQESLRFSTKTEH